MLHLYHGDGKGKTTAAMGLAIRSAGTGNQVIVSQFLKGSETGEIVTLRQIPNITVLRNEIDLGFVKNMTKEEKAYVKKMHNETLQQIIDLMQERTYPLLVMDELMATYNYGLIAKEKIRNLILDYKDRIEIVVTGRNPDSFFIDQADYITEMKKIKHPFDLGIPARKGVEY